MEHRLGMLERDVSVVKEDMHELRGEIVPKIQEKLSDVSAKITVSNAMWGTNILFLGFILYKLWDLTTKVYALCEKVGLH